METIITYKELGTNGRLGNQLFQIAATLSLARGNLATAKFPKWEYAIWFKKQLNQNFIPEEVTFQYNEPYFHHTRISGEDTHLIKHDDNKCVINLHGYFQSEKYFEQHQQIIKDQFEFSELIAHSCSNKIKEIKQTNSNARLVSVHLRFGDYVDNDYYAQLTKNGYYDRALQHKNFDTNDDLMYIVFSDDKKRAHEFMATLGTKYLIIANTSEIEDFCLMSMCDDNIISNSSFSWWASYLNKNVNKKVIAPKDWFGPETKLDTKDLYRKEMIII